MKHKNLLSNQFSLLILNEFLFWNSIKKKFFYFFLQIVNNTQIIYKM